MIVSENMAIIKDIENILKFLSYVFAYFAK